MTMGTTTLTFEDALQIARSCKDYGSEYRSGEHYEAFQHGVETVFNVLDHTKLSGIKDPQIARLYAIGAESKPSKPKVLNLNDSVRVKLTDHGRAVHEKDHAILYASAAGPKPAYTPIKEDAEGWSRWQLWVLMQAFGPHTYLGGRPCFEADIEVVG